MITPQNKKLCIKEYIWDQEISYYEKVMEFRTTLKRITDSKIRFASKCLQIFTK